MNLVNYKLILLINSFSKEEIELFRKFISSPFFTKGRNYIPFLDNVIKLKSFRNNTKNSIKYKKEKLPAADSGKNFSEQTLRNRYSELYKLGEEFLINLGLSEKKAEKDKILLGKLLERKLYIPYSIRYKETFKQLHIEKFEKKKFQNLTSLAEMNSHFLHDKNKIDQIYTEFYESSNIKLCLNLIDFFETGYEFAQQEFDSRKFEPNYVLNFLKDLNAEEMMKSFSRSSNVIFKVTAMNYFLYKAFENENEVTYYTKAHKIFKRLFGELKDSYKVKIFNHMINFCIRKLNLGFKEFRNDLFELYNEKLEQKLISDLKSTAYLFNYFREYVYIGLSLYKYEWVEKFIEKYSDELPEEMREDETSLSYAKLNLAKGKFERSLKYLENIKPTYYLLYIDSSLIRLCNHYELENYEEAYFELDRLKHYLRNHKEIPAVHRITIANFVKTYQKLLKYVTNPANDESGFILNEIESMKLVGKKDWLIKKIIELDN
ncbi:MAG TPA: hypothetical protein PKC91_06885 [Ignavibacteria bacterium]|nr:hypothetical protein [Ignavibacteria bacterium]